MDVAKPDEYKKSPLHPIVGLHSPGEIVKLLDKSVWSSKVGKY